MQLAIVVGTGLFGLLSLLPGARDERDRLATDDSALPSQLDAKPDDDMTEAKIGKHWFNMDASSIHSFEGVWEEIQSLRGTRLLPMDSDCVIFVEPSWKKGLERVPVPMGGSASIGHGWLIVDQLEGARVEDERAPIAPSFGPDCSWTVRSAFVLHRLRALTRHGRGYMRRGRERRLRPRHPRDKRGDGYRVRVPGRVRLGNQLHLRAHARGVLGGLRAGLSPSRTVRAGTGDRFQPPL